MTSITKDYLKLHFIVLIWGFTAILGNLISLPPVELVFYRTLIATLALLPFFFNKWHYLRVGARPLMKMLGIGVLIGMHWVLFFASAKVSTASVCLAGMATCSLWTSFIEPLLARRKIRVFEVGLGLVIMCGLFIVFKAEFDHALGLSLALISAFFAAFFSVLNGRISHRHNPYVITFYEMASACATTVLLLPVYHWSIMEQWQGILLPLPIDWLYIFVLALICTVYAFSISVELMQRLSVFAINLTINLEPIYGMLLAILIFKDKEEMHGEFYVGMAIILMAVLSYPLFNRYLKRKAMPMDKLR